MTMRPRDPFVDLMVGCVILAVLIAVVLELLSLSAHNRRYKAEHPATGPGIVTPSWHDSPGTADTLSRLP